MSLDTPTPTPPTPPTLPIPPTSQASELVPSVARYVAAPELPAPCGHLFASVCWLVARHPIVLSLARRVLGVVDDDGDVLPWVLADAVAELDAHVTAWSTYERMHPEPVSEDRWQAWLDAGPKASPVVHDLAVMSRTELSRLRLLATFSDGGPVLFRVPVLDGFDAQGQRFVADWMTAVLAYLGVPGQSGGAW